MSDDLLKSCGLGMSAIRRARLRSLLWSVVYSLRIRHWPLIRFVKIYSGFRWFEVLLLCWTNRPYMMWLIATIRVLQRKLSSLQEFKCIAVTESTTPPCIKLDFWRMCRSCSFMLKRTALKFIFTFLVCFCPKTNQKNGNDKSWKNTKHWRQQPSMDQ